MSDPRYKMPKMVIVLNIIMIVIVLAICGLSFSLAYSEMKGDEESSSSVAETVEQSDGLDESGEVEPESTTTATTTTKVSVSMTKRTTEPTEPVEVPPEEPVESEPVPVEPLEGLDTSYDKSFFAEDLFIGDSITTGLELYSKLDRKNVAASVGYTPYKAYSTEIDLPDGTVGTALDYAERMQPKRVFIMLGSNGLASASAMEDSYRTLIDKLAAYCPNSTVYCISVSPVTSDSTAAASSGINNEQVRYFNTYIKGVCSDYGIKYLDLYELLLDENGCFDHEYAEMDGLHFKGKTYDVMLSYIQNELS